jgi:uncharacterized protein (UPF0212 family)
VKTQAVQVAVAVNEHDNDNDNDYLHVKVNDEVCSAGDERVESTAFAATGDAARTTNDRSAR